MKICTKCHKSKPLEDFSRHKDTKDGRQGHCKVCNRRIVRQRRKKEGGTTLEMAGTKKFSTERYCETCDETKDWKAYYAEQGMCRQCWRAYLTRVEQPVQHHSKKPNTNMDSLLKFLERKTRNKNKTNP